MSLTYEGGDRKKIRLYVDGQLVGEGDGTLAGEHDEVHGMSGGSSVTLERAGEVGALDGEIMDMIFQKGKAEVSLDRLLSRPHPGDGAAAEDEDYDSQVAENPHIYLRWNIPGAETYVVQPHDHFVYEVLWEGTDHIAVALDIAAQDGTHLRDSGVTDQHQLLAHPSTDLTEYAADTWVTRIIKLPPSFAGQIVPFFYIACEKKMDGEAKAILRNVRFVSAAQGNPVRFTVLPDVKAKRKKRV